jgi:hypothetical protein
VSEDKSEIIAALKRSGFPLQTRVEQEIQTRGAWTLLAREHRWIDRDQERFVDAVACYGTIVLVVECKKAQEHTLLFLRPSDSVPQGMIKRATVWHVDRNIGAGNPWGMGVETIELHPPSYVAPFCVTPSNQRLLEPDAQLVVRAADDIMSEQLPFPTRAFFTPVIVTTAALYTLYYDPPEIPLATGEFHALSHDRIVAVDWVRFHKSFVAGAQRTVLVVNSGALPKFLDEIGWGQDSP